MMLECLLMSVLNVNAGWGKTWWEAIQKELGRGIAILFSLLLFFVGLFVLTVVFYLAGLLVVGKKRVRLSDAFVIAVLGNVLSTIFLMFIPYWLLALAICVFTWLLLIKRLYETGWLGAIAVGITAAIIYLAVLIILALIFGIIEVVLKRFILFSFLGC